MLLNGDSVKKNKKEAAKYLKKAADTNNAEACLIYGIMLDAGDGIKIDHKEAAKYFKIAADKGNSDGIFEYGCFLLTSNNYNNAKTKYLIQYFLQGR